MKFDLVIDANVALMETPIWDTRSKTLLWTDLFTGEIFEYNPKTNQSKIYNTNSLIGSAIPCEEEGKLFCAIDKGMCLLNKSTGEITVIANPKGNRDDLRYNDTRIDKAGRIFTSTVSKLYGTDEYKDTMLGDFYMIDTDKSVTIIKEGINQYNAICWNSTNTKMFVIDTFNNKLLSCSYNIAKGPTDNLSVALNLEEIGMPDGMCTDTEDNLYICHWAGKISVWDKHLKLKKIMDFPVPQVCCCGFGGEHLKDFYVASARYAYSEEQLLNRNGAGGMFKGESRVKGVVDNYCKF